MRAIEITAQKLAKNARISMRESALNFRKSKAKGDSKFMVRWLKHAVDFRDLAKGYLEAA